MQKEESCPRTHIDRQTELFIILPAYVQVQEIKNCCLSVYLSIWLGVLDIGYWVLGMG